MLAIIAEKPSLARNIVAGIGDMTKKNGYYENADYVVTWAFGHLFSLYDIEDYMQNPPEKTKWTLDNLPCFPEKFEFKLKKDQNGKTDDGVKKQFGVISALLNRPDVTGIVNAGDSDREGEIIVRLCINHALKSEKPVYRLWLPDQTPQTVAKGIKEMKSDSVYDNLAKEGFSRTYIDWLYGVNLTRYATIKSGTLLRVGRVIVPIVKAIYDRDNEIKNFKPETYYALVSKAITAGEEIELVSKYKFSENEKAKAEKCCVRMNALQAVVTDKKAKKEVVSAGKLYSLTKLQNHLGKKYKMPMERSLAIAQKLYENGYISYPRTNSEYLATNEKNKFKKIIGDIKNLGYGIIFKDKKLVFDDSKIESHSALTPTYKIPQKSALSNDEYTVYSAIFKRFCAVFCEEECVAAKTEINVSLGGKEDYKLKGSVIVTAGWTKYDGAPKTDKILPDLKVGDIINVNFRPEERQTAPPKHYTIETLNNYLKNPFRDEKTPQDGDEEEYKAIFKGLELGTEATRTGIIDNAKKSGYISLKKDVYYIENNGTFLIEQLLDMNISMDKYKTSELGQALKKVYHGDMTVEESVNMAKEEIKRVFDSDQSGGTGFYGDCIGVCPKCGKAVLRGRYSYACEDYKKNCDFSFNIRMLGCSVPQSQAMALLGDGKTDKLKFVSKAGKPFEARLKLGENGKVVFDFN